jgi:DNA polymerase-3 subunit gamma/tau
MILKTAPREGITLLSGVASDQECKYLIGKLAPGELVRIMGLLQQTAASFTRSASRRVDAELCILNMCEPGLSLDAQAMNARLSRVEEQLRNGVIVTGKSSAEPYENDVPPIPDDDDALPLPDETQIEHLPGGDAPVGFWSDLVTAVRTELKPPLSGFFVSTPNAPIQARVEGHRVVLLCSNAFTLEMVNKPALLELVSRKASGILGRNVRAIAADAAAKSGMSANMESLLEFGRAHQDIVTIKEN